VQRWERAERGRGYAATLGMALFVLVIGISSVFLYLRLGRAEAG